LSEVKEPDSPPPASRSHWARFGESGAPRRLSVVSLILMGVGLAYKFYDDGKHDLGFAVSVAIAASILIYFLSPDQFTVDEANPSTGSRRDMRDMAAGQVQIFPADNPADDSRQQKEANGKP
jgi:hypothetical protein